MVILQPNKLRIETILKLTNTCLTHYNPLKTFRFSNVFRSYRKATPGCNGLMWQRFERNFSLLIFSWGWCYQLMESSTVWYSSSTLVGQRKFLKIIYIEQVEISPLSRSANKRNLKHFPTAISWLKWSDHASNQVKGK